MKYLLALSAAALVLASCQSTDSEMAVSYEGNDSATRAALLEAMSDLDGRWQIDGAPEPAYFEFAVSSAGSVVRETMFPGDPGEMTNMYSLDGDALTMIHYCGYGNQPRMRASTVEEGRIVFENIGVSDRASEEEHYMGAMTLVFIDENHIEEIWREYPLAEEPVTTSIKLTRVGTR